MSTTEPPAQPPPPTALQQGGALEGRWVRVTDPPPTLDPETIAFGQDASLFPAEIEFRGGTHRAQKGPDQRFIVWDAGTYSVDRGRLAISLANDAIESYALERSDEEFTVVDTLGRRTTYRRQVNDSSE